MNMARRSITTFRRTHQIENNKYKKKKNYIITGHTIKGIPNHFDEHTNRNAFVASMNILLGNIT